LVGGVTAIQGASAKYPSKEEALVRNVDLPIFGRDRARSMVDLGSAADAAKVKAELEAGEISTFYIHLAEGIDDSSRAELSKLEGLGLLREQTVIIHGTALTEEQLGRVPSSYGRPRAISGYTVRPPAPRTPFRSASPWGWAPTGSLAAARACWPN
jgi:hypothetical protein